MVIKHLKKHLQMRPGLQCLLEVFTPLNFIPLLFWLFWPRHPAKSYIEIVWRQQGRCSGVAQWKPRPQSHRKFEAVLEKGCSKPIFTQPDRAWIVYQEEQWRISTSRCVGWLRPNHKDYVGVSCIGGLRSWSAFLVSNVISSHISSKIFLDLCNVSYAEKTID